MEGASRRLEAGNLKGGADDQEEALEELKRAQENLAEDIEKKEAAEREEMARMLVARLQGMLAEQELISSETKDMDAPHNVPKGLAAEPVPPSEAEAKPAAEAREGQRGPPASPEEKAAGARSLARRERALDSDAEDILRILAADDTSVMVPPVLKQVQKDVENVAGLLDKAETGAVAQLLQKDIETALRELIEALKPPDRDSPPGSPQGRPMRVKPRDLVTPAMEVKMLLSAQRRIRQRTEHLEALGLVKEKESPSPPTPIAEKPEPAPSPGPELDPLVDQARKVSQAEEGLAGLTEALIKKYPLIDILLLGGGREEAEDLESKEGEKPPKAEPQGPEGPEGIEGQKKKPKAERKF
jgi:hypothetical protein